MKFVKAHLGKFFLALLSFAFFFLILFPFSETSDMVHDLISDGTQNQVHFRYKELSLSASPKFGLLFRQSSVKTPFFSKVEIPRLIVSPSLSSIFTFAPAGSVVLEGLFGQDSQLEVSLKSGTRSDTGLDRQKLEIHTKSIGLAELKEFLDLPVVINGSADLNAVAQFDNALTEPPDADFQLSADQFELPSQALQTQMGPINIPTLKFSSAVFKGKLSAGRLVLEEGRLGTEKDDVHGTVTGNIGIQIQKGAILEAKPGNYSFDINLYLKPGVEDKLALFLATLEAFKSQDKGFTRYEFRLAAQNINMPPTPSALH